MHPFCFLRGFFFELGLKTSTVKFDVIVNSLGTGPRIKAFGKICSNIVKKAGTGLKDEILSWEDEAEIGHIFTSKGYKLPTKHIIHVVTPFFKHDPDLYALEFVYKKILLVAFENGWTKIGLPLLGTGSNGYPHSYVIDMATKLLSAFAKVYKNMDITLCIPVVSKEDYEQSFDSEKLKKSIEKFEKEFFLPEICI